MLKCGVFVGVILCTLPAVKYLYFDLHLLLRSFTLFDVLCFQNLLDMDWSPLGKYVPLHLAWNSTCASSTCACCCTPSSHPAHPRSTGDMVQEAKDEGVDAEQLGVYQVGNLYRQPARTLRIFTMRSADPLYLHVRARAGGQPRRHCARGRAVRRVHHVRRRRAGSLRLRGLLRHKTLDLMKCGGCRSEHKL